MLVKCYEKLVIKLRNLYLCMFVMFKFVYWVFISRYVNKVNS